jgi:hypothetical protein
MFQDGDVPAPGEFFLRDYTPLVNLSIRISHELVTPERFKSAC